MSIELVMPSNHLILCRPLLLLPSIFPSIRVFSNESALQVRWPKYWRFSFSISPSNEHPGLISFRMDWLDLLALTFMEHPHPQQQNKDYFQVYRQYSVRWKYRSYSQSQISASKRILCSGINLIKEGKIVYTENDDTDEINQHKYTFSAHKLEDLILLNYPYYSKQQADQMQSLPKVQQHFFNRKKINNHKCMEPQKILNNQSSVEKEQNWKQHAP